MVSITTIVAALTITVATARPIFARLDRVTARRRLRGTGGARSALAIDHVPGSLDEQCAEFLDDVVRGLRNHDSLFDSVSMAVHRHPHLSRWLSPVVVEAHRAGSFADARADGAPEAATLVIQRLRLASGPGSPSVRVLDAGSRDLRTRVQLRTRALASAAGVRSSVTVLSWLPWVMIAGSLAVSPGVAGDVVRHPASVGAVTVGLLLNHAGRAWMRRIVALAVT